jgi:outer membrane protein OmpA-like peptidoglycan-associated protein
MSIEPAHSSAPAAASRSASLWVVALALCGCASSPPTQPGAPVEPGGPPATADRRASTLAVERRWLQSWFEGTPVHIGQRNDGAVSVEVPREFCFDAGRSVVKAPLAAVLDKVAESLRRNGWSRLALLAAPADDGSTSPLAVQRAAQVRKHLISRGVPGARLGNPTATTAAAVQLRMEAASP